jgi:hypothetical protein
LRATGFGEVGRVVDLEFAPSCAVGRCQQQQAAGTGTGGVWRSSQEATAAPQVFVPAFGGHMPYVEACLRLCGAITHSSLEKARLQYVPRPAERVSGRQGASP